MPAGRAAPSRKASLPTTMQAVAIDRFGPPDVLTLRTMPVPELGPRDVLIALDAAGVGVWDARIRDGTWASGDERFPLVLGTDGAGTVVKTGTRARRFRATDRVWAYEYLNAKGGFYAEYVAVHEEHVGHAPPRLTALEAGAAAVTGLTAQQGIDDHLRVRATETVLIFGASGAVGTLAVQFAKRHEARVVGTATGPAAMLLVRQLGADAVFDARGDDAEERLQEFAPVGFDAALVLAGGVEAERCLDHMLPRGRVAYPNGVEPEPRERPDVRNIAYDAIAGPREFERLERAVDEAQLTVPIAAVYPLAAAAEAHRRLEQGHVLGRIALRIREQPTEE